MTGMDGQILREKKHDIICDRSPSSVSVTGLGWMHCREREKKKIRKKKIKCEQRTCTIAQKVIM